MGAVFWQEYSATLFSPSNFCHSREFVVSCPPPLELFRRDRRAFAYLPEQQHEVRAEYFCFNWNSLKTDEFFADSPVGIPMKKFLFAFFYYVGASRLVAWWNRKRVVILCYHSVTMLDEYPAEIDKQYLPRRRFETHLDHLHKYYNVISLQDYLTARREGQTLPQHSVILTFDDGTRNFLTVVVPLLAKRSFKSTNFIVTDLVSAQDNSDKPQHWTEADDSTCLSWPEIRALAASRGIDFGSHTCTHPRLVEVTMDEARCELEDSYKEIVEQLQCERLALAYPHNQTSDALKRLVQSLGYACALTADPGPNDLDSDLFSLRRTVISDDDDLAVFAARVAGVTWWANKVRDLFRQPMKASPKDRKQSHPYFQAEEVDQE